MKVALGGCIKLLSAYLDPVRSGILAKTMKNMQLFKMNLKSNRFDVSVEAKKIDVYWCFTHTHMLRNFEKIFYR